MYSWCNRTGRDKYAACDTSSRRGQRNHPPHIFSTACRFPLISSMQVCAPSVSYPDCCSRYAGIHRLQHQTVRTSVHPANVQNGIYLPALQRIFLHTDKQTVPSPWNGSLQYPWIRCNMLRSAGCALPYILQTHDLTRVTVPAYQRSSDWNRKIQTVLCSGQGMSYIRWMPCPVCFLSPSAHGRS